MPRTKNKPYNEPLIPMKGIIMNKLTLDTTGKVVAIVAVAAVPIIYAVTMYVFIKRNTIKNK